MEKMKTYSKFKLSVSVKDPSLVIEVEALMVVETNFCKNSLRDMSCLELNVI